MSCRYDRGKKMSEKEAREIIDNEARSRDFWCVDYKDHRDILQQAIDVIYNTIRGNQYNVDYQENQNGTRLIIRCEPCSKDLSSLDPFKSHESGKAHNKIRQQILTPKNPNLEGNLELRPLNTYRGIFSTDSLEDMIDRKTNTVLGIQFVYKEVIDGKERFTCQLCQKIKKVKSISTSEMFSHLVSQTHNSTYLRVKYNVSTYDESHAKNIEEREGKIHGSVIDFSMQYLLKVKPELVSSNFVPLGKKCITQIKDSPSARSQRRSNSRSPRDRSRRHRKKTRSRSISPIRVASTSSPEGRPPSPVLFDTHSIPLPPPLPPKPVMVDVGISVDMVDQARSFSASLSILGRREALDKIAQNKGMQELLHQSLWYFNQKLEKYFAANNTTIYIEADKKDVAGTVATNKLKSHIKDLKPTLPDSSCQ